MYLLTGLNSKIIATFAKPQMSKTHRSIRINTIDPPQYNTQTTQMHTKSRTSICLCATLSNGSHYVYLRIASG